jgi:phage-related minor tail protein
VDAAHRFTASLLTALADLGAGPAVLVFARVLPAFFGTEAASLSAGSDHVAHHLLVGACPSTGDRARRRTNIGAVEIEPDALGELLHVALAKAGVGAGDADLRAIETLLDTFDEGVVDAARVRKITQSAHLFS